MLYALAAVGIKSSHPLLWPFMLLGKQGIGAIFQFTYLFWSCLYPIISFWTFSKGDLVKKNNEEELRVIQYLLNGEKKENGDESSLQLYLRRAGCQHQFKWIILKINFNTFLLFVVFLMDKQINIDHWPANGLIYRLSLWGSPVCL